MKDNTVYLTGEAQERYLLGKEIVTVLFPGKSYQEVNAELERIAEALDIIAKKYDVSAATEIVRYGQIYTANTKM